jgi:hypothetical protein
MIAFAVLPQSRKLSTEMFAIVGLGWAQARANLWAGVFTK